MKHLTPLLCLLIFCATTHAENTQFISAKFNDRASSLKNTIAFPKQILRKKIYENVIIRCDALINVTGKIALNYCSDTGNKVKPYVSAINLAAKGSTIQPGKVNGVTKKYGFSITWYL